MPEALFADLAAIRDRGYAVELQDSDVGLGCVAVTVPGLAALSDAISITAPTVRLDPDLPGGFSRNLG
jgi:IclR family transcriptional regulator, acetate operon repressor